MRSPESAESAWVDDLTPEEFEEYERRLKWVAEDARPEQLTPDGDWSTWLLLAGRGFGKTRTAAEDVAAYGLDNPGVRIAVVAETFADGRDTCIEGESGLFGVLPESSVRHWNRSLGDLVLTNGTRYKIYSGDKPNQLRGPQHHRAWCDELAKFMYAEETWTQLQLGLRLGDNPQCVVTTTPRPIPLIRELVKEDDTYITTGSTYDNADNLAPKFLKKIRRTYEGTKLGDQELHGRIVELDGESIFKRDYWREPSRRYDPRDGALKNVVRRRYLIFDTAFKDTDASAYTACVTLEVLEDYRVVTREVWRDKLEFPDLLDEVERLALRHGDDGLLAGVVIEDRASGISAVQSLRRNAPSWLARLIRPFAPPGSKDEKCRQAALWCRQGVVMLPQMGLGVEWLTDFEEELFQVPDSEYRDMTDAFALGIIFLEEFLEEAVAMLEAA